MMRASSHAIKAIYVTSTGLKLLRSYIYFNVFQLRLRCKQVMADKETDLGEKYKAVMVLSGVGDALGYKNGSWEFCHSGTEIHKELKQLGGLEKLDIMDGGLVMIPYCILQLAKRLFPIGRRPSNCFAQWLPSTKRHAPR